MLPPHALQARAHAESLQFASSAFVPRACANLRVRLAGFEALQLARPACAERPRPLAALLLQRVISKGTGHGCADTLTVQICSSKPLLPVPAARPDIDIDMESVCIAGAGWE